MEITEITLSLGMTIPTGKLKSVRVDVGASARGSWKKKSEIDKAYGKLEKILSDKLNQSAAEMAEAGGD